jgi:hypothetical protein
MPIAKRSQRRRPHHFKVRPIITKETKIRGLIKTNSKKNGLAKEVDVPRNHRKVVAMSDSKWAICCVGSLVCETYHQHQPWC